LTTTGALTVSAWIRPATLTFPSTEGKGVDLTFTYIFINRAFIDSDIYLGKAHPHRGTAPLRLGTRDFNSFFEGEIRAVRVWNRLAVPPHAGSRT
jgi:hypothetical protein